jgi:hypothetical protein
MVLPVDWLSSNDGFECIFYHIQIISKLIYFVIILSDIYLTFRVPCWKILLLVILIGSIQLRITFIQAVVIIIG